MKMHAMLMKNSHEKLIYTQIEKPTPSAYQILIKVNVFLCFCLANRREKM